MTVIRVFCDSRTALYALIYIPCGVCVAYLELIGWGWNTLQHKHLFSLVLALGFAPSLAPGLAALSGPARQPNKLHHQMNNKV
mmetsp:Transcript_23401/g.31348  ORF Transcript_23401/g.31348 Transcript_23401/m.31348 type:complete len:83 (+) Transcript_23401:364-612(+)